ncbi:sigma-70 family RNA polymerase sigma factor [Candidatus Uhrbacteria bacterium]|nr:sigma-70 family RNA polymerase sigma factor [Candidatus Uhrbacteria bacterium]
MHRNDFHNLYKTFLDPIYRFIYFRVGGDSEVAEDLTSEVFMKALEHIEKLDADQHPKSWLYTVARNKLKNHYRDRRQEPDVDKLAPFLEGEDGRKVLESMGNEIVLFEAMSQLSDSDRRVVEMKHIEGFSFNDIADITGKKSGAVRVQAHRALKQLRSLIKV